MNQTERRLLNIRYQSLFTERETWRPHWAELSRYISPRNGRFFVQDRNKGDKRHNSILDNTGTKAASVLAAGLMSGLTSPARKWFRLGATQQNLNITPGVKEWLTTCENVMLDIFQRSNTYRALHSAYLELAVFGTACILVSPDFENVIHLHPMTIGEYLISTDPAGSVCTMYREFDMTVSAIVREYGYDNCSPATQNLYDNGYLDQWVTVRHSIEPRQDRDTTKADNKNMPWRSVTWESGASEFYTLRESGFEQFPVLAPRWSVEGGDIYGNSPGMIALGDIKQLQHEQLRKGQAIDFQTNPPLQVPTSLKDRDVDRLPGGITFVESAGQNKAIQSMFEVNLPLNYLLEDIQDVRQRINGAFFADIFLMLGQIDTKMTAYEVAARNEEKMLMLGPVLERLQNELLDPLIDITFHRMIQTGIVPPPPPELQGQQLNVELISMLAQAQRAVQTNSIDRFVANMGAVAQLKPEVLDKFDVDEWADRYADITGVDPNLIVDDDKVKQIRDARAKQQAAIQQQQMNNIASQTAANLGGVDTGGKNAATDLMNQFSGYTTAGA